MALNPPLTLNGDPCRVEGEFFIMKRDGIEFEMKVENGNKYTAKGFCILSTSRIVCINNDKSSLFKCFDLPLLHISKESFEQPIFGSNYITGICSPLFNLLPGNIKFKIWFTHGGCGTFIPAFFDVISKVKKTKGNRIDDNYMNKFSKGTVNNAYIDKSDPSVIYYEQPSIVIGNLGVKKKEDIKIGGKVYDNLPSENEVIIKDNHNLSQAQNSENTVTNTNDYHVERNNQYPNINNIQVNNPIYSQNLIENENNVNNNQGKYFGFFGPSLNKSPNQVIPNQINPNQINPNQTIPNQVNINQVIPNQINPNQVNTNQVNPSQVNQENNNIHQLQNQNQNNQNNSFSLFNNQIEEARNQNQERGNNNYVYN